MEEKYELIDGQPVKTETEVVVRQIPLSVEELEARLVDADNQIARIEEYKAGVQAELDQVNQLLNN